MNYHILWLKVEIIIIVIKIIVIIIIIIIIYILFFKQCFRGGNWQKWAWNFRG
jgi:hypothetical protein